MNADASFPVIYELLTMDSDGQKIFNEEETGGISLADVIEAFYDCLKRKRNTLNALEFEMDFERNCLDL